MASESSNSTSSEDPKLYDTGAAASFENKAFSQYSDPCQEAARRSIKCMHRNQDKDLCNDYFQAYRECKKQWMEQRRQMKANSGKGWFG